MAGAHANLAQAAAAFQQANDANAAAAAADQQFADAASDATVEMPEISPDDSISQVDPNEVNADALREAMRANGLNVDGPDDWENDPVMNKRDAAEAHQDAADEYYRQVRPRVDPSALDDLRREYLFRVQAGTDLDEALQKTGKVRERMEIRKAESAKPAKIARSGPTDVTYTPTQAEYNEYLLSWDQLRQLEREKILTTEQINRLLWSWNKLAGRKRSATEDIGPIETTYTRRQSSKV